MFELLSICAGAAVNACMTYFIDVCMRPGMIFERYYDWLVDFHARKNPLYENAKFNGKNFESLAEKSFWFKPFGGCATCMNVWLGFFSFPLIVWYFSLELNMWLLPLFLSYIFVSNAILRKCLTD